MNPYDHEDAFKAANRCAGRRTKLADALKRANDEDMARAIIQDTQEKYSNLFEAFIEGVAYGRENPAPTALVDLRAKYDKALEALQEARIELGSFVGAGASPRTHRVFDLVDAIIGDCPLDTAKAEGA